MSNDNGATHIAIDASINSTDVEQKLLDGWGIYYYVSGNGTWEYRSLVDLITLNTNNTSYTIGYGYSTSMSMVTWRDRTIEDVSNRDWENDIKFLTVGDTTWILNSSIKTSITTDLTPTDANPYSAFYWIKKSFNDGTSGLNHGYTYSITLSGLNPVSYNHTDSIAAASNIASQINGNSGYTARSEGSIIYIYKEWQYNVDGISYIPEPTKTHVVLRPKGYPYGAKYEVSSQWADIKSKLESQTHDIVVKHPEIEYPVWSDFNSLSDGNNTLEIGYIESYSSGSSYNFAERNVIATLGADFTISSGDSWGNQASIAWKGGVAKIADLPASMEGFTNAEVGTIAITGTDKDTFTNYYLEWDTDHWKETVKEGIEYKIDYLTMPAKLVRQSDGSFALGWNIENLSYDGFATIWEERDKGDDDSNPIPSFIGSKLSNMFFLKNRLCFTSEENVIMSKIGSYYNFFATTVIEVLDDDPIDAAADSNNISVIRAVNVTGGAVTLWTDTAQFILTGGETLSPTTTRISQTSSYVADTSIPPINVDNEVIFFNKKGNWLEALTYSPSTFNNDNSTAGSISSHVPAYLPSTINHVEVSQSENLILMLNPLEPNYIYCYKYHIHNNGRTMSAWFKWEFPVEIKKINVLSGVLFILADINSLYSLELDVKEITDTFLDDGVTPYTSSVLLSRFSIETRQKTQAIQENFYMKTVRSKVDGMVDFTITNEERNKTKTIVSKHLALERRILVGGHSDKVKIGYTTNYDNGCAINVLNVEGSMKLRSKNY